MPPFSGQVQLAQSETYRALTLDGNVWEIQYVKRTHVRVATLTINDIIAHAENPKLIEENRLQQGAVDQELVELLQFLATVRLPFEATDHFEYWLLDSSDKSPLALIFSCSEPEQMDKFPARPEWTALPAAVMPVEKTAEELADQTPPVNYRLELLVAERAGTRGEARWFNRSEQTDYYFPPLLINEHWPDDSQNELCRRYIARQAPRLLMLPGLATTDRAKLETYCKPFASEVGRFCGLYPQIVDTALINALRVEAQLRAASGETTSPVHNRRDGILYI